MFSTHHVFFTIQIYFKKNILQCKIHMNLTSLLIDFFFSFYGLLTETED